MEKTGTFNTLKSDAIIFTELASTNPTWWQTLCNDKELYINVRKDNYINVYYYGGSVAKIEYKNKSFVATTHQKYLGDNKPRGKNKKGNDIFQYDKIDLSKFDKKLIDEIKHRIFTEYSGKTKKDHPSEKLIQGKLLTEKNTKYIDSEFQFNKDEEIGKLRIDLIELKDGILTFVELKGITDSRLRNDKIKNPKKAEILEQMEKYKLFIEKYADEIKDYYQKLIDVRSKLKIDKISNSEFVLNKTPKLLIANTYKTMSKGKIERKADIDKLLIDNKIDYSYL